MSKQTTIELRDPISGPNGAISAVTIREPRGAEYFELGDPQILARNPDGTLYTVENDKAVQAYIERCVISPDPLLVKAQISLADGIALKNALLGFFLSAREAK